MSDISPPEKNVTSTSASLSRLWTLTIASLSLNSLILLLLVIGAVMHHPRKERMEDRDERGGPWGCQGDMREWRGGPVPGFCRYNGDFGPGPREFGPGDRDFRGGDVGRPGPWNEGPGRWGDRDGGPRGFGGGPRPPGMMGFGPKDPHDPAKMTDGILSFLTNKLTLTDDQKTKLKPIIADQVTQMQKDIDAQRQAMQKKIEDAKAKIRPLLNADQQKQLDALPLPGQKPPADEPPDDKPGE